MFARLYFLIIVFGCVEAKATNISVCFEEWAPYAYLDENGKASGSSVDRITAGLNAQGVKVTFAQVPHSRCLALVTSKETDFALHVDSADGFELLEAPVANWALTFAVRSDDNVTFQQLVTTTHAKLLLSREYVYPQEVMNKLEQTQLKISKASYNAESPAQIKRLFSILVSGRVDAMLVDKVWADLVIKEQRLPVKTFDMTLHIEPQFVGYHTDNKEKAALMAKALTIAGEKQ